MQAAFDVAGQCSQFTITLDRCTQAWNHATTCHASKSAIGFSDYFREFRNSCRKWTCQGTYWKSNVTFQHWHDGWTTREKRRRAH